MENKNNIFYIAIALVVGFIIYKKAFYSSDEAKIEKALDRIEVQFELKEAVTPLQAQTRFKNLSSYLDPNFRAKANADAKVFELKEINEIRMAMQAGARMVLKNDITRTGQRILVNGSRANVYFKAILTGTDYREIFDVSAEFVKNSDGKWLLSFAEATRETPN